MNDEFLSWYVCDLSDLPDDLVLVNTRPKVPEDQEAIDDFLETKSGSDSESLQNTVLDPVNLDLSGFTSISLCCTVLIVLFLFISRR